uniref:DDE-1 domain-containing protein n=1 Tax=Chlorocebus sabaeus TaxID=60711 RepID=A0A0D9RWM1_CHLSB
MASKCSSKKESQPSLALNHKLKIELSEESPERPLVQTGSQVVNAKEKFLKKIKSTTPINTQKVLVVQIEDLATNIPLKASKALTLLNVMKADRGEEAAEEKCEWFMRLKERTHLHNIKWQGKAVGADTKAATSYSADTAKITDQGSYTRQQIFNTDETIFNWKKMLSRTFIAKEKSMSGFKASKDRLTMSGANAACDFRLNPMIIYYSENPRDLKNYAKAALSVLYKWNNAWMTAHLFTAWFTKYFKRTVEKKKKKKKISFKILLLIDNAPSHPRADSHKEINVVFMLANTTSILQPMNRGIGIFKAYFNEIHFVTLQEDSDSSDGSGQSKLKIFWKGFIIPDAIKNIPDSWEEIKISTLTGIGKKFIPILMDDFEAFKVSVEGVTADVEEIARELELELEPEDATELLQSHEKALMDKEFPLMDKQKRGFMKSIPGEDAVNTVEMTTNNSEYYRNLVDTAVAGFERTNSNFERKMLSNSTACYREIFHERKSMRQTSLLSYFKKSLQSPQPSATTTLIRQQPSTLRQVPPPTKKPPQFADGSD